jgi:hypothetical protein
MVLEPVGLRPPVVDWPCTPIAIGDPRRIGGLAGLLEPGQSLDPDTDEAILP